MHYRNTNLVSYYNKNYKKNKLRKKQDVQKLIMCLIPMIKIFLFSYLPMVGLLIAFEKYIPRYSFFSPWNNFENFKILFLTDKVKKLIFNAIAINMLNVVLSTIVCATISVFMFNLTNKMFLSGVQTCILFPVFLSWPLVAIILEGLIGAGGVIPTVLGKITGTSPDIYNKPELWRLILVLTRIWKCAGLSAIINYSVLLGSDKQVYDAAKIDGANRFQQMLYISIPTLKYLILVDFIIVMGNVLKSDFEMNFFIVGTETQLYDKVDVLESYFFRALRYPSQESNIGQNIAIGLFQGVIGLILSCVANFVIKVFDKKASIF